jgi:acetyl-CoA carboxylase biotin carboxyl carrier protein
MRTKITSEIAGQVWKVIAKQGDSVAVDDVIVILESMKMEIPVQATKAGVVSEILVAEEDMISEDQHIASIESE